MKTKNKFFYGLLALCVVAILIFTSCRRTTVEVKMGVKSEEVLMQSFARKIAKKLNVVGDAPIFLAMLPTVNDTTKSITVEVLEDVLTRSLLEKNIYIVRRKGRKDTIAELELALVGLVESGIVAGGLVSPQYFLKLRIDEARRLIPGAIFQKEIKIYYSIELRDASSQVVVFSARERLGSVRKRKEIILPF